MHDELVFDVPLAEVEIIQGLVKREREEAIAIARTVPLTVAVGVGKNWREAY